MRSTLQINEPADDLQLLTITEMRAAAGVTGSAQDTLLKARGLAIAAAIMSDCNIAVGKGGEPTLLQETLTETFHSVHWTENLLLARRHNVEIVSVAVDDTALDPAQYDVEPEAGILYRISDGFCARRRWYGRKIVVVYKAGFEEVPGDLKMAAMDFFTAASQSSARDPFVKSETREVPGLRTVRKDYWVGSVPGMAGEDAVPDIVSGQLKRFRNSAME